MKHCKRCGQDKPLSEFYTKNGRKTPVQYICAVCARKYRSEHNAKYGTALRYKAWNKAMLGE